MSKSLYLPINQIDGCTERIESNIVLPQYVDSSKVLVNVGMINFLAEFSGTEIAFNATREDDTVSATIAGFDETGNAYAGKIKQSDAPTMKSTSESINSPFARGLHAFRRRKVNVDINMTAIENDIRDSQASLRNTDTWAKSLNTVVQDGVRKGNVHSLLWGMNTIDWCMASLWYVSQGFTVYASSLDGLTPADLGPFAVNGLYQSVLVFLPSIVINTFFHMPHEKLYSFFGPSGPKFDRALVVSAVSQFTNFVKTEEEEK